MAGLNLLYKLLLKEAAKGSGKASGILSIGPDIRKITMNKYAKYVDSAKKQGVDLDKLSEEELKYIIELNKPKGPMIGEHRVIDATSPEGKEITESLFGKKPADVLDLSGKKIPPGSQIMGGEEVIVDVVSDTVTNMKKMAPMDAMAEANSVIARKGKYKNLTIDESQDILKKTNDHIFERDIKYDEFGEIIKPDPEDFAGGGAAGRTSTGLNYLLGEDDQNSRVPLGGGKLVFDAARRKFLQIMGAGAATGVAAKSGLFSLLKAGKPTAQVLTSVPIKSGVDGMPVWFKPFVNKIIKEGDDVTKKFADADRQIVHKTKLPDSKTDVLVTQDLTTGDVLVDIGMGKHGFKKGHLGQPVRLEYKAAEDIMSGPDMDDMHKVGVRDPHLKVKRRDEMTFDQKKYPDKTPEEFWVEEAEFTGGHPENIKFEETVSEKFGQHGSDFTEVEKFATGKIKKKTAKESIKAERAHWTPEGDYASGGRVPFIFGGGAIKNVFKRIKDLRKMKRTEKIMKPNPKVQHLFTKADNVELAALKLEHAEAMLDMLKSDRQLFIQLQSNKAMKDEGLDFLMKKMIEPMAPHMKGYKSLKEIDEAILNMEMIVKNKVVKEGRQLNATGGRVSLSAGGLAGMLGE